MNRKQKHYGSEKALLKAIEDMQARIRAKIQEAETYKKAAVFCYTDNRPDDGDHNRALERGCQRSLIMLEARMKKLKEALSVFRTELLPGVTDNRSVAI